LDLIADELPAQPLKNISQPVRAFRVRARASADGALSVQPKEVRPLNVGLIALGPNILCLGEVIGVGELEWRFRIQQFVLGDAGKIVEYIGSFEQQDAYERYVLSNDLGDGRALSGPPALSLENGMRVVACPVDRRPPRIPAAGLSTDWALSEDHDLMIDKAGKFAEVSGVAALPQRIKTCLSHQRGESPFHLTYGARLSEFTGLLDASWLDQLMKLELVRHAAIPYPDTLSGKAYTPLQCIERVWKAEVVSDAKIVTKPAGRWVPIRVDLEVNGVGRWTRELSVLILDKLKPTPAIGR
jgi:hypothetical protein